MVDVTAILLICSYKGREFIRVGYYVNNYIEGEENNNPSQMSSASAPSQTDGAAANSENPDGSSAMDTDVIVDDDVEEAPRKPIDRSKLMRHILADQARVTRFEIPWDAPEQMPVYEENSNSIDVDAFGENSHLSAEMV